MESMTQPSPSLAYTSISLTQLSPFTKHLEQDTTQHALGGPSHGALYDPHLRGGETINIAT